MTDPIVTGEPAGLTGRRWVFGPALLDERSLELRVGGEQVRLERKPLEVLLYLLHHAGEVVTKDDLAESLWPGRILTDTVLTRCISLLRQALEDDDRSLIRTVHGYGYRLVADVRVEAAAAGAKLALDFRPGDHPPLRPQWKLVERLGTGGHGEAWLARHEKTGDARVFKFALDVGALTSLKREITLYRLLHDTLGPRAAIARILEWNLAEPPYFIEMEHIAGGNLQTWSEAQGGLSGIPLEARLEIAAQVGEALAAAHSVGALHKDLKPGNVLVHIENGKPSIRLCDFGSGGVLDPQRLEALGITRLGFTKTLANGDSGGTPLYLAPEVVGGQPFTVQADVYALGVLLYQLVCGDLRKALAPGWEADVPDELLREDIAAAAAGNPARRLTDAGQLAERGRTLEARREVRAAEVAARKRAELARRALAELRRTRVYALVLLVLAGVAVGGGVTAYRARNEAIAATATAQAISSFLMEDVFRMDPGLIRPSEASYEALLGRAAQRVGLRLRHQPEAAADIHWSLGRRYHEIGQFGVATKEYEMAADLFTKLYGAGTSATLMASERLAWAYVENGEVDKGLATARAIRNFWESRLAPNDLALLAVRVRIARTFLLAGSYDEAERELRATIQASSTAGPTSELAEILLKEWFGVALPSNAVSPSSELLSAYAKHLLAGSILDEFGGYAEAESILREAIAVFSTTPASEDLLALGHMYLAITLAARGSHLEAEISAGHVTEFFDRKLPAKHHAHGLAKMALGRVRLEGRRFADAVRLFSEAVDLCGANSGCPPRVRAEFLWDLGRANLELGRTNDAIEALKESLTLHKAVHKPTHPLVLQAYAALADALRRSGAINEASETLSGISREAIADLRPYQQAKAELVRVEGLLLLHNRERDRAAAKLRSALEILEHRLGPTHWRTARARAELSDALQGS
jgi:eukaryotic-like serine/threonine-protein kinase